MMMGYFEGMDCDTAIQASVQAAVFTQEPGIHF